MRTLVDAQRGAAWQTQLYIEVRDQPSAVLAPSKPAQTILFIAAGSGTIEIGTRRFKVGPTDGVMVLPGEGFRLTADAGACLQVFVSMCSAEALLRPAEAMPPFNDAHPERVERRPVHWPHPAVEGVDAPSSLRRSGDRRRRRGRHLE
jgi:hypothetical protein